MVELGLVTARAVSIDGDQRSFGCNRPRAHRGRVMAGTWGKSRHRSKNMCSSLSVEIASHQLRHGPSSLASTRQLMSMSSHVFGKAVAESAEANFAELLGLVGCDLGERE